MFLIINWLIRVFLLEEEADAEGVDHTGSGNWVEEAGPWGEFGGGED